MRVLLDTNLVIGRENPQVPPDGLTDLLRLLAENGVQVMVSQESIVELGRDPDSARRATVLAKVQSYPALVNPLSPPREFTQSTGGSATPNDAVDIAILFAVKCDAVSFLLTEDRRLIRRALRSGLADRVFSIRSALDYFKGVFAAYHPELRRIVRNEPLYAILPRLDSGDPFFRSIIDDYPDFSDWAHRKAREGRECVWLPAPDETVGALLIYKAEAGPLLGLPAARRLKLCTFKVSEKVSRRRVSELLLSWGLSYAYRNRFEEAFVTVLPRHEILIDFFESFGFVDVGVINGTERVLVKRFGPPVSGPTVHPVDYFHRFFPAIRTDESVRKFIIPVEPVWHARLFPEFRTDAAQRRLEDFGEAGLALVDPAGYAIRKAYLCNSPRRAIGAGDVALFYRSQDVRRVTHLGVIEQVKICHSVEEILDFVGNRTVLPLSELTELCNSEVVAILFWSRGPARPENPGGIALGEGVSWPQSITQITQEEFQHICG